ncbi:PAAR domain-containing protein [Actinotalea ferrariae]|uniref:PAAR domain-containing protein n=1 Tax=Actinotalea ferrariae TaxID=1386098 RepID=UPI001C8CA7DF|nr:PAAR domain-containing protein [Actinotalea ferrariae]
MTGTDTHIVLVPSGTGTTPVAQTLPFAGRLRRGLSTDVTIDGRPAAVVGSVAVNAPKHVPVGGTFQRPPSDQGTVDGGSRTVLIDGRAAARVGDRVVTCNDPTDAATAAISSGSGTVEVG